MPASIREGLAFAAGVGVGSLVALRLCGKNSRGRATSKLATDTGIKHLVGVDIGGTSVSVALVDSDGVVIARRKSNLPRDDKSFATVSALIIEHIMQAINDGGCAISDVAAVGIGAPGNLDCVNGVVISAANLDWKNVPLTATIAKGTGLPTVLENDANTAVLAEWWVGAGAGEEIKHMIMFTLGTGIGGGIIYEDRLIRGSTGMAGEFGHTIIEPCVGTGRQGRLCAGTGVHGVFEQYASARALEARAKEELAQKANRGSSMASLENATCADVFDHAASGDSLAQRLVDETADYLAVGLINACRALDPQLIVLSGGMSLAGDKLLNPLNKHFQRRWWSINPVSTCRIAFASTGYDAGIVGAACAGMQSLKRTS